MSTLTESSTETAQGKKLPDFVTKPVRLATSVHEGYQTVADWIGSTVESAVLPITLASRHPWRTAAALVSAGSAIVLVWSIIGDKPEDHEPISKKPQVTLTNPGDKTLTLEAGQLPIKDVLIASSTDKPANKVGEKFDYSGWKKFPGLGFSLLYPNEEGWRVTSSGIILGEDGDEDIKIEAKEPKVLINESFQDYVEKQYAAEKKNRPGLVTSQSANFPGWKTAGYEGEVIGWETKLRPDGRTYVVRRFFANINHTVYQVLVSQEISQIQQTDSKVMGSVNSLQVAGASTGASKVFK